MSLHLCDATDSYTLMDDRCSAAHMPNLTSRSIKFMMQVQMNVSITPFNMCASPRQTSCCVASNMCANANERHHPHPTPPPHETSCCVALNMCASPRETSCGVASNMCPSPRQTSCCVASNMCANANERHHPHPTPPHPHMKHPVA